MNRLNTIHDIIYGPLRPWHRDNLLKSDDYWKERTVTATNGPLCYKNLFFSPKLRCYRSLIDSDIDRYVAKASAMVEATKSANIALLKMKDTREAVEGFAKAAMAERRTTGISRDDILNDNADLFDQRDRKETYIIMDYTVVALARCYFTMQNVCSKVLTDSQSLDLSTFCTSILGRQRLSRLTDITTTKTLIGGSTRVDIKNAPAAKKVKDDSMPYTVNYKYHGADRAVRLNTVMQTLVAEGWIAADTTPDSFFTLFEGKPWRCNVTWTGSAASLCALLNELTVQPFIEMQKGCNKALIAKNQFGKAFDYRGTTDEYKEKIVNTCIDLLNPKFKLPSMNSPAEDDADSSSYLKAQLREAKFEPRKRGHWAN